MKITGFKTENSQRQIAWFVLAFGLAATGFGLFGVWLQGSFWDISTNYVVMADQILHSEVVESFCLPTIVTSAGGLAIAWVILASKFTEKHSSKQKNLIFVLFVMIYFLAIFVPAKLAGDRMWREALKTEKKSNPTLSGLENSQPIK